MYAFVGTPLAASLPETPRTHSYHRERIRTTANAFVPPRTHSYHHERAHHRGRAALSAPRQASQINRASAPVVAFLTRTTPPAPRQRLSGLV